MVTLLKPSEDLLRPLVAEQAMLPLSRLDSLLKTFTRLGRRVFSMALNPEQIDRVLTMTKNTQEVEMTYPECLDQLDRYNQNDADGSPIEGVLERVREHLEACPCCSMQLNLMLDTLKAMEDRSKTERTPLLVHHLHGLMDHQITFVKRGDRTCALRTR